MDNNAFTRNEGSRIVYYRIASASGSRLWEEHWEESENRSFDFYERYAKGHLGYTRLRHVFLKHLPKQGKILEAGCGLGQFVLALRARGYDCMGVDFAVNTISNLKKHFPDLPVTVEDIRHLNMKNESLSACISLGVMEHFVEGPHVVLNETARVLKKGGSLIVSVPQAFPWRRLEAHPEGTPLPDNASFYQYAYSADEFRKMLRSAGFNIQAEYGYSLTYAFRLRFKAFAQMLTRYPKLSHIDILTDRLPFGHNISRMRLFVATKES